jgi:hypothetical protein
MGGRNGISAERSWVSTRLSERSVYHLNRLTTAAQRGGDMDSQPGRLGGRAADAGFGRCRFILNGS